MDDHSALRTAIDLMNMPSRVRIVKSTPVANDVIRLLRIASGDSQALREAVVSTDRSPEIVKEAAEFYIEQVLLQPDADSYRVLGATSHATSKELRANMILLIKWLHPDRDPEGMRTVFISRVTGAWDDLKTPENRADYDRTHRPQKPVSRQNAHFGSGRHSKPGPPRQASKFRLRRSTKSNRKRAGGNSRKSRRSIHPAKSQQLGIFRRLMLLLFNRTIR